MSVRGADEQGTKNGSEGGERRAGGGRRLQFEALVAIGESEGSGGGFEAESVDVSADGMRLRTAYLPSIGDKLICRFEGPGTEVIAEGEVIWANDESGGGEFGLKFIDPAAAEPLRELCMELGGGDTPADPVAPEPEVALGARMRLHIAGLGSPMKARVRGGAGGGLEVGSNLEFLTLGRTLELEDVERGERREAFVDTVTVDIDPETSVPQLVVSLRYEAQKQAAPVDEAPKTVGARTEELSAFADAPRTARPASSTKGARSTKAAKAPKAAPPALAKAAAPEDMEGEESFAPAEEAGFAAGVSVAAARFGKVALEKMKPALAWTGATAQSAMVGAQALIARKRAEHQGAKRANAPRRTTAVAPSVLKSEGRRLVREESAEGHEVAPASSRRAAIFGGALGLAAVLVVVGVTKMSGHAPAKVDAAALSASNQPPAGAETATPVANVPLFGATPLSTTEPIAVPTGLPSALASAPPMPPGVNGEGEAGMDAQGPPLKEWGQGTVTRPKVLTIKMDGPIERLNGASGAMGFTISVPNRRSTGANTELRGKDKRLASVKVINTSQGAEVTLQFKGDVPPYVAKIKTDKPDTLEIDLGTDARKTVAKKKKKPSKKRKKPVSDD